MVRAVPLRRRDCGVPTATAHCTRLLTGSPTAVPHGLHLSFPGRRRRAVSCALKSAAGGAGGGAGAGGSRSLVQGHHLAQERRLAGRVAGRPGDRLHDHVHGLGGKPIRHGDLARAPGRGTGRAYTYAQGEQHQSRLVAQRVLDRLSRRSGGEAADLPDSAFRRRGVAADGGEGRCERLCVGSGWPADCFHLRGAGVLEGEGTADSLRGVGGRGRGVSPAAPVARLAAR